MCGIAGCILNKRTRGTGFPIDRLSRELLLGIENRGIHATGFVTAGDKPRSKKPDLQYTRLDVKATDFVKDHGVNRNAYTALLHTRHWTKGDPKDLVNNHPVQWNTCFVIHNGSISNDDDLIKEAGLESKRMGEVDSWAIPVTLGKIGWDTEEHIKESLGKLKGGFAFAAYDPIAAPHRVLLAKGDTSPLYVMTTPHGMFWASERKCLLDAWGNAVGTPPQKDAKEPGEYGIKSLMPGDYWVADMTNDVPEITAGRFTVAREVWTAPARYRREQREWTCWPDEKNCIFGEDCGNCWNESCRCYEGNHSHPKLNSDTTFKEAIAKYPEFKRHVEKYKIAEDTVSNPTMANSMSRTPGRGASGKVGTAARTPSTSQVGSIDSIDSRVETECYFCHGLFEVRRMIVTRAGDREVYKCPTCVINKEVLPIGGPGIDPVLAPFIRHYSVVGEEAMKMVDACITETAWECKVPEPFVRYCVLYSKQMLNLNKDQEEFLASVKTAFSENITLHQEVRRLEATK